LFAPMLFKVVVQATGKRNRGKRPELHTVPPPVPEDEPETGRRTGK